MIWESQATALTGAQCGIVTDGNFARARIQNIETNKLNRLLDEKNIVIVAGFQGITTDHEITTLGRGGSDTTATALAAAMQSPVCEIYTDVDGVFTADPRLVPDARLLRFISYEEMLGMRRLGLRSVASQICGVGQEFRYTPGGTIQFAPGRRDHYREGGSFGKSSNHRCNGRR